MCPILSGTMSLLGYPKIISYTKFEHFGICHNALIDTVTLTFDLSGYPGLKGRKMVVVVIEMWYWLVCAVVLVVEHCCMGFFLLYRGSNISQAYNHSSAEALLA